MPIFQKSISLLLLPVAILLSGCSDLSSESAQATIVPGEDFAIIDAYYNSSYYSNFTLVVKNLQNRALPHFYMDYFIFCEADNYKDYGTTSFTLNSNEQETTDFYLRSESRPCTFTITAIRPYSLSDSEYNDWTGNYVIPIGE